MAYINFQRSFIRFKVVYYGPGLCGKTTNLEHLHKLTRGAVEMVSIDTEGDRTIFFDYMPLELGKIGGIETVFKLYTVPGQVRYNRTRQMVLRDVDGVVFVADSQRSAMEVNIESLANLAENLSEQDIDLQSLPLVFQHNKRDLPDICSVEELERALNLRGRRSLPASAIRGENVKETFAAIANEVYRVAAERYGLAPGLADGDAMRAVGQQAEILSAQPPAIARYLSSIPPALPEGADDWKSLSSSRPPFGAPDEGAELPTLNPNRGPISDAAELKLSGMEKKVLAQLTELRQTLEQLVMTSVDRDELEEHEAGAIEVQSQMAQQIAHNTERLEELLAAVTGLDRTMNGLREAIARDIRREVDGYLTSFLESREREASQKPGSSEPPLTLEPVPDDEPTIQQRHEVHPPRRVSAETQPPPRHYRRGRYSGPGEGS
jgi:hypothetical protein